MGSDKHIYFSFFYDASSRERFLCKKMAFLQDIYTEQEIIDQAIAYKIQHIPSAIGWRGKGEGKDIKIIPYCTVEEFKKKESELLYIN